MVDSHLDCTLFARYRCSSLLADDVPASSMPVDNTSVTPEFTITINDTSPVWVYCGQTGHCGQGMVFSVNALEDGGGHSFEDFQRLANNSASVAAVSAAQSNDSPPGGGGSDSGTNAASPSARVPFITVGLAILFVVML
jgi:hypothetical protein